MLLETLEVFLANDCSWARTAQALHLHVNTVHYRIQRIEALPAGTCPASTSVPRCSAADTDRSSREVDVDVRRLDPRRDGDADIDAEFLDGLPGDQRDQPVRTGLDLHLGGHIVDAYGGHDPGERVAYGGGHTVRYRMHTRGTLLRERRQTHPVDHAVPRAVPIHTQPTAVRPPANGLRTHTRLVASDGASASLCAIHRADRCVGADTRRLDIEGAVAGAELATNVSSVMLPRPVRMAPGARSGPAGSNRVSCPV
jgi:hypothetical protein